MSFDYPELEEFWEDLGADLNRDHRNRQIWVMRAIAMADSETVEAVQDLLEQSLKRGPGTVVTRPLMHFAYQALPGSALKQWGVNQFHKQVMELAEIDLAKAMEECRKAACFKYDDNEFDRVAVSDFSQLAQRRAENILRDDNTYLLTDLKRLIRDLRDSAYLARPRSVLEEEACRLFKDLMEGELKDRDPEAYFNIFYETLEYPFENSELEDSLCHLCEAGIRDMIAEQPQKRGALGGRYAMARQNGNLNPVLVEALEDIMNEESTPKPSETQQATTAKIIQFVPRS